MISINICSRCLKVLEPGDLHTCSPTPLVRLLESELSDAKTKIEKLLQLLQENARHDSWRCDYYSECWCGLDAQTDDLGLPRIPRNDMSAQAIARRAADAKEETK